MLLVRTALVVLAALWAGFVAIDAAFGDRMVRSGPAAERKSGGLYSWRLAEERKKRTAVPDRVVMPNVQPMPITEARSVYEQFIFAQPSVGRTVQTAQTVATLDKKPNVSLSKAMPNKGTPDRKRDAKAKRKVQSDKAVASFEDGFARW